jgi:hypothetical protein
MACVNQTRPHYVNQMGKTQSNDLAERHGRGTAGEQHGNVMGTAWERHGMCESAFKRPAVSQVVMKFPRVYAILRFTDAFNKNPRMAPANETDGTNDNDSCASTESGYRSNGQTSILAEECFYSPPVSRPILEPNKPEHILWRNSNFLRLKN